MMLAGKHVLLGPLGRGDAPALHALRLAERNFLTPWEPSRTEAVGLVLEIAFDGIGLHRVQAAVMPRNIASLRVVEKAGFALEGIGHHYLEIDGVSEDHVLFAMILERFRAGRDERV